MIITLLSLFLIGLLALSVHADITDAIQKSFSSGILKFIFYDFAEGLQKGTPAGVVGGRILFALLIFSVLFGASQLVLKNYAQNIRIMIASIIALIASFAMPAGAIVSIAVLWGGLFYFLTSFVIVAAAFFIIFKVYPGEEREHYFIKFVIAAIMAYVMTSLTGGYIGLFGGSKTILGNLWSGFDTITSLIGTIFTVMAIYFFYKFLFPGAGGASDEIPEETKKALARWWKRKGRADFSKEPTVLDNILKGIKGNKPWSDLKKQFNQSDKILKRINGLIVFSYKKVKAITNTAVKTDAEKLITQMEAEVQIVRDGLQATEINLSSATPDYGAAETALNKIIASHKTLMSLEIQFLEKIGITF